MNILIPKVVKPLQLAEYAEEFGENCLQVWVNPPIKLISELNTNLMKVRDIEIPTKKLTLEESAAFEEKLKSILDKQLGCYAEILGQGDEKITVEDLRQMAEETSDTDPNFWPWVKQKIAAMIAEHRVGIKKA